MNRRSQFVFPDWNAPAVVRAAVTTRLGGVSQSPWESFNLATHVGDDEADVRENRRLLRSGLGLPAEPIWLDQVHGVNVANIATASQGEEADAAVAFAPRQVCAVMTADCLPVLLCDRAGSCVAAAHAGWRGLLHGVLESTITAMGLPGEHLLAWLGPAIGPQSFEVGPEVREAFLDCDEASSMAFQDSGRQGHYFADLYELARQRLLKLGVRSVTGGDLCTYSEPSRFYSYRRDGQCGRMASLIWMENVS